MVAPQNKELANLQNLMEGMEMYNSKYGIMFKCNPLMQCILGQFEGWQMVLESFNQARPVKKDDDVLFSYNSHSQFNKLVKHIQKINNSQTA